MPVYNDEEAIVAYRVRGVFPKIHDPIAEMIMKYAAKPEMCFDLGSSIGLLPVRLVEQCGRSKCIGFEPGKDFSRAVRVPNVQYMNIGLSGDNLTKFADMVMRFHPTLITARRVFPEIHEKDIHAIDFIAKTAKMNMVEHIVLQGRVPVKNPRTELYCVENEIKALSAHYSLIEKKGQVAVLKRRS
jgi:hypothetical protein